jgi:hypothetical protein
MDLLAAIKREEGKLEKELAKLQGKLSGVRAAAKASEIQRSGKPNKLSSAYCFCGRESQDLKGGKSSVGEDSPQAMSGISATLERLSVGASMRQSKLQRTRACLPLHTAARDLAISLSV